jgi:tetratricopeptide (TPR) repeat protein
MGGFTLEAAEEVCSAPPLDEFAVLDLLGHLVDKSLVQADDRREGVRYRMLETLRQYARARLAESEEVTAMRRRHAQYFRALAEEAEPHLRGTEEDYWFDRLDEELDNFRQAMGWAVDAGEGELAQATAGALYRYFMYRFRSVEGREWAEAAVVASDQPSEARAKALLAAGTLAQISLDYETSMKHLDQAIDLARSSKADDILSAALNNRANVSEATGMFEEAERLWMEDLDLSRRLGWKGGVTVALTNLSGSALNRGDYDLAIARASESVDAARDLESERMVHQARATLFAALRRAGEAGEAAEVLGEMIEREEQRGFSSFPGQTFAFGAVLAMDRGEFDRAADLLLEGVRGFATIPDYQMITWVVQWLLHRGAHLLANCGEPETAARLLGASEAAVEAKAYVRGRDEQRQVEATREAVQGVVEKFQTLYEAGRTIGPRDALDLLREELEKVDSSVG